MDTPSTSVIPPRNVLTQNIVSLLRWAGVWRPVSMVTKVAAVTATLLLIVSVAGGFFAYLVASSSIEKEIQFTGEQLVTGLAGSILPTLSSPGAEGDLQIALNKITERDSEGRIESALILDKNFRILAAKNRGLVGQAFPIHNTSALSNGIAIYKNERDTIIAAPVQYGKPEPHVMGYVVFGFGQHTTSKALNGILFWFSLVFLVAFVFSVATTRFVLARLLRPIVELGQAAEEGAKGNFDFPIKEPTGKDEIALAGHCFRRMQKDLKNLIRFTNLALVRKIQKGDAPDKPEEAKLTIAFGDGVKYTPWSAAHTPTEIIAMLNGYFTLCGLLIDHYDGIIDKFIGDGIMSHFGLEGEEDKRREYAQNAIRSKFCTQIVFSLANTAFERYHSRVPLRFRFGIATGKCVVGPYGAKGVKEDYSLIGNQVNLGSRLEKIASPGGVSLDNFSFQNAGGKGFLVVEGPTKEVIKGIEKPVPVYKIIGFKTPEENEKIRQFLLEFFAREEVKAVLKLSPEQYDEFMREVKERLSGKLELPVLSTEEKTE